MNVSFIGLSACATALCLAAGPGHANACDCKPSKLAGAAASSAAAALGGSVTAAGVGMQAAGYYTLVHSTSGLVMIGSTATGASAAGTTGIIAGTGGVAGSAAAVVMAPATIVAGAITAVAVSGYEGVCWFYVDRVTDENTVFGIVENIAANDPFVTVEGWGSARSMVIRAGDEVQSYKTENLYLADRELKHRDWFFNTNLGVVTYTPKE